MNREAALKIAEELDRRALLHNSNGTHALTESELEPVTTAIIESHISAPSSLRAAAINAAREIVEMIEAEREPHPEWSKNARRKYRDKAMDIISKHVSVGLRDAPVTGYEQMLTTEWDATNTRRHELITKKPNLTEDEAAEFRELQWLAGMKRAINTGPDPVVVPREDVETLALVDSQWIAGAQFGWNCGDDRQKLNQAINDRISDRVEAKAKHQSVGERDREIFDAGFSTPKESVQSAGDYSMYEDELPADMPKADYNKWFALSKVDGVRVGPRYPFQSAGERIVETVFDNTGASPETLKRTMIERIDAAILDAERDAIAKERERCASLPRTKTVDLRAIVPSVAIKVVSEELERLLAVMRQPPESQST